MENKMETTTVDIKELRGFRAYKGSYWDNGKENGNYYNGGLLL